MEEYDNFDYQGAFENRKALRRQALKEAGSVNFVDINKRKKSLWKECRNNEIWRAKLRTRNWHSGLGMK